MTRDTWATITADEYIEEAHMAALAAADHVTSAATALYLGAPLEEFAADLRRVALELDGLAARSRARMETPAPSPALNASTPAPSPTVAEHIEEPRQPMQLDGGAGASLPRLWSERGALHGVDPGEPADTAAVGQGLTLPSGWAPLKNAHGIPWFRYGLDVEEPGSKSPRYPFVHTARSREDGWHWATPSVSGGYAPTMLQAMCDALGIEITPVSGMMIGCYAEHQGTVLVGCPERITDIDACARRALERFHALQQAKTPEAPALDLATIARPLNRLREESHRASDCKCWFTNGKRQANRWCSLPAHAAEWRTFAEQGSPELDPRERGMGS